MEKLRIYYSVKGNGILFGFLPPQLEEFKKIFPDAQPAKGIFVQYDIRSDFKNYHAQLESFIFPALVGFPTTEDLKRIKMVEFFKTPDNVVTYTINNYEQEVQSLHR
jgi:hypothetical protein